MICTLVALLLAATPVDPAELFGNVMSPSPDIAGEIAKIRIARDNATPAEKPLYDRLIATLAKMKSSPGDSTTLVNNIAAILRDLANLYPHDFQVQLQIASSFVSLPYTAESLRVDPTPYAAEGLARVKKLVGDFPNEGRAWHAYASAMKDEREMILAFKKCVELEPDNAACRTSHARLVANLARPQCLTKDVTPTVAAFTANLAAPGSAKTVKWQSELYTLDPAPIFVTADIALISRNTAEERTLDLELTPAGTQKLTAATTHLANTDGRMALMVGDTPLTVAHVMEPLTNGRMRISTGTESAEAMHYKLCKKVKTPKVPEDLRLP